MKAAFHKHLLATSDGKIKIPSFKTVAGQWLAVDTTDSLETFKLKAVSVSSSNAFVGGQPLMENPRNSFQNKQRLLSTHPKMSWPNTLGYS